MTKYHIQIHGLDSDEHSRIFGNEYFPEMQSNNQCNNGGIRRGVHRMATCFHHNSHLWKVLQIMPYVHVLDINELKNVCLYFQGFFFILNDNVYTGYL